MALKTAKMDNGFNLALNNFGDHLTVIIPCGEKIEIPLEEGGFEFLQRNDGKVTIGAPSGATKEIYIEMDESDINVYVK